MTITARVLVVAAFALVACRTQSHDSKEPRAIAQAFDDFENASPTDRAAALEALKNKACSDPADCADRDACVRYASAMQTANALTTKAKSLGPEDGGGSGAATPKELATIVSAADDAVKEAESARQPCLDALDRLHRRASGS